MTILTDAASLDGSSATRNPRERNGQRVPSTHASGGSPDRDALRRDRGRHGVGGEPGLPAPCPRRARAPAAGVRDAGPRTARALYVVEQTGRIRIIDGGRLRAAPFLDIRSRIVSGGEQGLLGLAFAPGYARNGTFYVNYTAAGDGANTVARYRARNGRVVAGSAQVILRIPDPYANHNGGNVAFGPDGRLWVGTGDGGSGGDPEDRAQNMDSLLGKMLRLDVRRAQPSPEIVALGLRNPWRYSFDRRTGDLWIGDVGQNASRRSTAGNDRAPVSSTSAGTCSRGARGSRTRTSAPAASCSPSRVRP